ALSEVPSTVAPSKRTVPLWTGTRPSMARPRVVLPEPLSPTSAKVEPGLMAKDTPSTASRNGSPTPATRARIGPMMRKRTRRFSTSRRFAVGAVRGSAIGGHQVAARRVSGGGVAQDRGLDMAAVEDLGAAVGEHA